MSKLFQYNGEKWVEIAKDGRTPIKGVDYFDGYTPIKGKDYFDGKTPIKGVDYFDGIDGREISAEDIVQKINTLPTGIRDFKYKIKAEHIDGLKEESPFKKQGYHGGGMSTNLFISGEVVSGSGTTWTLANTPALFIGLYIQGQRVSTTRGDYSISDKTITTTLSWSAGDLEADYYKQL